MEKRVLKRKLNPFLLITTVLVLAILAGSSVFYQTELDELVSSKKELSVQLENKTQQLKSLREKNSNLSSSIRDKNSEIERLNNIRLEKEGKIENVTDEVQELKSTVSNLEKRNTDLNNRIGELESDLQTLNFSMEIICESNETIELTEERCSLHGY